MVIAMINSVHVTLTRSAEDAALIPTFLMVSTNPEEDANLFRLYVPVSSGERGHERVRLVWTLPDPAIRLGQVELLRADAVDYQASNRACGGVRLLMVRDAPGATDRQSIDLTPFYADWLGRIGGGGGHEPEAVAGPVSGLGRHRARRLRQSQPGEAVQALIDEVALATRADGTFSRDVAYTLHEAAIMAEACGLGEAWEYFETVALMIYPNCHDALIGLAMRAKNHPEQAFPLLARAYRIRSHQDDLLLFARSFARPSGQRPAAVHEAILDHATRVDLTAPIFRDASGRPLHVPAERVVDHLRAFASRLTTLASQ